MNMSELAERYKRSVRILKSEATAYTAGAARCAREVPMTAYYPPTERSQMRSRLQALCGRPLTDEEATELKTLASWLDVRLEWTRTDLRTGRTVRLDEPTRETA